jgi:hypothetical protein
MILAELEEDRRCDRAFARSLDTLAKLAAPAMAEFHAGKTHELDPETLLSRRLQPNSVNLLSHSQSKFILLSTRGISPVQGKPKLSKSAFQKSVSRVTNLLCSN